MTYGDGALTFLQVHEYLQHAMPSQQLAREQTTRALLQRRKQALGCGASSRCTLESFFTTSSKGLAIIPESQGPELHVSGMFPLDNMSTTVSPDRSFPNRCSSTDACLEVEENHTSDLTGLEIPDSSSAEHGMHLLRTLTTNFVHHGVGCDQCGMYPIIGERYQCIECRQNESMGFDLCAQCMAVDPQVGAACWHAFTSEIIATEYAWLTSVLLQLLPVREGPLQPASHSHTPYGENQQQAFDIPYATGQKGSRHAVSWIVPVALSRVAPELRPSQIVALLRQALNPGVSLQELRRLLTMQLGLDEESLSQRQAAVTQNSRGDPALSSPLRAADRQVVDDMLNTVFDGMEDDAQSVSDDEWSELAPVSPSATLGLPLLVGNTGNVPQEPSRNVADSGGGPGPFSLAMLRGRSSGNRQSRTSSGSRDEDDQSQAQDED